MLRSLSRGIKASHVRVALATTEHTSGTALPLPIDRPTAVTASLLLLRFLPPTRPVFLFFFGRWVETERPRKHGVGPTTFSRRYWDRGSPEFGKKKKDPPLPWRACCFFFFALH